MKRHMGVYLTLYVGTIVGMTTLCGADAIAFDRWKYVTCKCCLAKKPARRQRGQKK